MFNDPDYHSKSFSDLECADNKTIDLTVDEEPNENNKDNFNYKNIKNQKSNPHKRKKHDSFSKNKPQKHRKKNNYKNHKLNANAQRYFSDYRHNVGENNFVYVTFFVIFRQNLSLIPAIKTTTNESKC